MKDVRLTKRNKRTIVCRRICFGLLFLLLGCVGMEAQDLLPVVPVPQQPLDPADDGGRAGRRFRLQELRDSLPATFQGTAENVIFDPQHVLVPVFEKLSEGKEPVRIVHIGDSHVRGHVYPLVVRRCLEADFGAEAVEADSIAYHTTGLARETGGAGPVYHILGVNGATCVTFSNQLKMEEIAALQPDLLILSFGTNEAHNRRYQPQDHAYQVQHLIGLLQESCPQATFLLTTPPGAYTGRRRSRTVNSRTETVARVIRECAQAHGAAVWDLYATVGGKAQACRNWMSHHLMRPDGIHFTPEGYRLQGNLLHQAFIKAYNDYVATGLD